MSGIFLGPLRHWLLLVVLVVLGWGAGRIRLHVTDFNLFTIGVLALTIAVLLVVLVTARPSERITRDPLQDD